MFVIWKWIVNVVRGDECGELKLELGHNLYLGGCHSLTHARFIVDDYITHGNMTDHV